MSFTPTKIKGHFKLNYVDNFTAYKCDGVKKERDGDRKEETKE